MRRALVLLAVAAAVALPATQSSADQIPPPVTTDDDGTCPGGYREVVQAGNTVVCVVNAQPRPVRPTTNGCADHETPYTVDDRYGVCMG